MIDIATRFPEIKVQLTGEDGNAFRILGAVRGALLKANQGDAADEFMAEATSGDYDHLLATCAEFVTVT